MYTIRKMFKFEGAHILTKSYSKECQKIHGHSYKLEVKVSSNTLNEDGMVIDFGKLKRSIQSVVDHWDHKLLIEKDSRDTSPFASLGLVEVPFNPTAENMCKFLYDYLVQRGLGDFKFTVRIHETDTGYAEYSPEEL